MVQLRRQQYQAPINELRKGFLKIEGCDLATGFTRIIKESDLVKEAKKIYSDNPGEDGYYNFTKFLWVQFPDEREETRLDNLVPYENK